jgi:hypothetical protein
MFKNVAHQLNATECESIDASENSSPSASKIAKDDFSSGTENASDSASPSEQSNEIDSTPGSGAAEARHEDECFSASTNCSKELSDISLNKGKDIRVKSTSRYETVFPDFYFSSAENGWLCKICTSFAHGPAGNRAFIDKPGNLGDHPTEWFTDH